MRWTEEDLLRLGENTGPIPGRLGRMQKRVKAKGQQPNSGMNKTEGAYATRLDALVHAGELQSWRFEPFKIRLAHRTFYTPDFMVVRPNGAVEFHETKGFLRDDAAVKFKMAAELFPEFGWLMVRRKKTRWEVVMSFGVEKGTA